MTHVFHNISRVPEALVQAFAPLPAASVYEGAGQRGMMDPAIHRIYSSARLCGPAVTVECHVGDNLMLHKAVTVAQPGDILVATIGNHMEAGAWGEILTVAAQQRGVSGFVIDGAVRDTEALEARAFPTFARGVCVGATMKRNLGTINHPLVCGNVLVEPGDLVLGDADGIVIIPQGRAQEVLDATLAREAKERTLMDALEAGKTTLELLNLSPTFDELGLSETTDTGPEPT